MSEQNVIIVATLFFIIGFGSGSAIGWYQGRMAGRMEGRAEEWCEQYFRAVKRDGERRDAHGKFKAKETT